MPEHQTVFKEGLYEALDKLGASHYAARLYSIAQDGRFAASLIESALCLPTKKPCAAQKTGSFLTNFLTPAPRWCINCHPTDKTDPHQK